MNRDDARPFQTSIWSCFGFTRRNFAAFAASITKPLLRNKLDFFATIPSLRKDRPGTARL
jgi:hypothetical protein